MNFLVLLLLAFTPAAFANTLLTMGLAGALEAGRPPAACGDQSGASGCSFAQVCSQLATNRGSSYLYENEQGGKIPNFALVEVSKALYQCGVMNGALFTPPPASATQFDPLAFQRWLVEQPAQVQADFNRIQLAFGDAMYSQTSASQMQPGEKLSDYTIRQYREAAQRAGIALTAELEEAIRRNAEQQASFASGYGYGMMGTATVDWSRLPAQARELLQDPFLNPAILSDVTEVGSAARLLFKNKQKEMNILVGEIKTQIESVLEDQLQRYPDRRASLEAMMLRIQTANFSPVSSPEEIEAYCPSPNAFYDPSEHTLRICPQMMGHPREHLRMVLAHELGHSIDPCAIATPFYRADMGGETNYGIMNFGILAQEGMPVESTQVSGPVMYPENPYREVLSCLASESSLNARLADPRRTRELVVEAIRLLRARGESTVQLDSILGRLPQITSELAGCSMMPGESRQQEGFSDWIAGEVMGKSTEPTNLTEVGGMFYALDCPGLQPSIGQEMTDFMEQNNCSGGNTQQELMLAMLPETYQVGLLFQELSEADRDEHSASVDRIDRLFANQPQLRARIGCAQELRSGEYCAP
jgi:hypothetical protein